MQLDGIHHITAITGDARENVDFYARLLGLRFVKKTVNYDAPEIYHLYYGDELGRPGSILTFFEFPGAPRGRAAAGMIHRLVWRVSGPGGLDFWNRRLADEGLAVARTDSSLVFDDREGLALELALAETADPPLTAAAPDVPTDYALQGFLGVRAYGPIGGGKPPPTPPPRRGGPGGGPPHPPARPGAPTPGREPADSEALLVGAMGAHKLGPDAYELRGETRGAFYNFDPAPARQPIQGAGTVHHIAWAAQDQDHMAWREPVARAGAAVTPIIDRTYFHSIYFREPSGVLFEIATLGPGFTVDEAADELGSRLVLPERYEPMRRDLERRLTPLENPRFEPAAR